MRAASVLIAVCGALAVLASNTKRGLELERDTHDDLVAPTPDSGTDLYEQWPQPGSVPVNRTEGFTRSGKRQPNNRLEARQPDVCLDPGYILVCPTTDLFPCCPPAYPICCHTTTCCPTGTFCVGKSSCCQLSAIACGEGCCPGGTTCCGTSCCTAGFKCVSNKCQSTTTTTSIRDGTTSYFFPVASTISTTPNPSGSGDTNTNNAAVIGGAVGGAIGGLVLIGGGVAAWYFFKAPATAAAAAASSSASAAQPHSYAGAGGVPASPFAGQPLMTSTSAMPTSPTSGFGAGFAAQQPFGAHGSPLTPSNVSDYTQPSVGQYQQSAYGAAAPLGSTYGSSSWGGQTYGQPGGFTVPDSPGPGPHPSYHSVTPAPTYAGSAYGGVVPEPMQPAQGAHGRFDYAQAPPSGPQVQTWVERPGGR